MNTWLAIYLGGFVAHTVLSHAILSNPNCNREANPGKAEEEDA